MSETLREEIITSESAKRMVSRVSPIYDNSYVGLWMFEAIGLEYDTLWKIVRTMPDQLFPGTVTWAIELWERRYGITPLSSQTLEERRRALVSARSMKGSFVPATLKKYIWNLSGRESEVLDYVADYTFGVYITNSGGMVGIDYDALVAYINRNKPSHMSYELALHSVATISIGIETSYAKFPYPMTGPHSLTGTYPDVNTIGHLADEAYAIASDSQGNAFPYPLCGTKPDTNTLGVARAEGIRASPEGEGQTFQYSLCGVEPCL